MKLDIIKKEIKINHASDGRTEFYLIANTIKGKTTVVVSKTVKVRFHLKDIDKADLLFETLKDKNLNIILKDNGDIKFVK